MERNRIVVCLRNNLYIVANLPSEGKSRMDWLDVAHPNEEQMMDLGYCRINHVVMMVDILRSPLEVHFFVGKDMPLYPPFSRPKKRRKIPSENVPLKGMRCVKLKIENMFCIWEYWRSFIFMYLLGLCSCGGHRSRSWPVVELRRGSAINVCGAAINKIGSANGAIRPPAPGC